MEQKLNFPHNLKKKIINQISPSKTDIKILDKLINSFIGKIELVKNQLDFSFKIKIGGSYAKNTFLKGNFDVDIFFIFESNINDNDKQIQIKKILETLEIEFIIQYGSRIYYSGIYEEKDLGSFNFECVPTQKFTHLKKVTNSTDVSIYHVENFQGELVKNLNLADEVRLAKQWCKAKKLYGAESYIQGFSGHSIECLLIKLQTFEEFINFLSLMTYQKIIYFDKDKYEISKDKMSALIIQDPITPTRNASSALSDEIFYKAKFEAIKMIKNGIQEEDFLIKKYSSYNLFLKDFTKDITNYSFSIEFKFENLNNSLETLDSVGSKCLKAVKKFNKYLQSLGFIVINYKFEFIQEYSIIIAIFELESTKISKKYYKKGPSLELSNEILDSFINANLEKKILTKNSHLYTVEKREIHSIEQIIESFNSTKKFSNNFISKSIKNLTDINLKINF